MYINICWWMQKPRLDFVLWLMGAGLGGWVGGVRITNLSASSDLTVLDFLTSSQTPTLEM